MLDVVFDLAMDQPTFQAIDLENSTPGSAAIFPRSDLLEKHTLVPDHVVVSSVLVPPRIARWNKKIENLAGLEARGIARVPPEERHQGSALGYAQMATIWFSANVTANNLVVGLLGPLIFDLGFIDSAMMATLGALLGSAAVAYMSIWGAQSGNRTMVCYRSFSYDFSCYGDVRF